MRPTKEKRLLPREGICERVEDTVDFESIGNVENLADGITGD